MNNFTEAEWEFEYSLITPIIEKNSTLSIQDQIIELIKIYETKSKNQEIFMCRLTNYFQNGIEWGLEIKEQFPETWENKIKELLK